MEEVNQGSIEYLPIEIADRLGVLTTLDGKTVEFKISDEADSDSEPVESPDTPPDPIVDWTTCNTSGMTAMPLIDATTLDKAIYKLRIRVSIAPEFPILGPFEFEVV